MLNQGVYVQLQWKASVFADLVLCHGGKSRSYPQSESVSSSENRLLRRFRAGPRLRHRWRADHRVEDFSRAHHMTASPGVSENGDRIAGTSSPPKPYAYPMPENSVPGTGRFSDPELNKHRMLLSRANLMENGTIQQKL